MLACGEGRKPGGQKDEGVVVNPDTMCRGASRVLRHLTIALGSSRQSEEELRRVGVLAAVGHCQDAHRVMLELEAAFLVVELARVN